MEDRNVRAAMILGVVLIVFGIAGGIFVTIQEGVKSGLVGLAFSGFGALLVAVASVSLRKNRNVPDILALVLGDLGWDKKYFEQSGLSFTCIPLRNGDESTFALLYQNRFARPCKADILIGVPNGLVRSGKEVGGVPFHVEAGGQEVGAILMPWSTFDSQIGKAVTLKVYAECKYPKGKGKMIRPQTGMEVGTLPKPVRRALKSAGFLAFGVISWETAAKMKFVVPEWVSTEPVEDASSTRLIIWSESDGLASNPIIENVDI